MPPLRLVGFSGSTRRPSRTTALVELIGRRVGQRHATRFAAHDIAALGEGLGAFTRAELPQEARALLDAIEAADALVMASPVYKGSYAGLFKHLVDFLDPAALAGKPVILAATGGGRRHALVVEHGLRPLFGFFAAATVPTGIYASDEDFREGVLADPATLARIDAAADELVALASLPARAAPLDRVA